MKSNSLALGLLFFALLLFASCKKDYTCKCIDTADNNKVIDSQIYGNAKEKDANEECNKLRDINKEIYEAIDCKLTVIE